MNFDGYSQWMGPGLGGIMAGTEQRQLEEKRAADTQKTLQDILTSQNQEARAGDELKLRQARDSRDAELHPHTVTSTDLGNQEKRAKIKRDDAEKYVLETARTVGTPGWEIHMDKQFPQMKDHPIRQAARAAIAHDQAFDSPGGAVKQLLEQITATPQSISARQSEEARGRNVDSTNARHLEQTRTREENANYRARIKAEVDREEAQLRATAAKVRNENLNQYAARLASEANAAADRGDLGTAAAKRTQMKEITMTIQNLAMATTVEKFNQQLTLLNQLAPELKLSPQQGQEMASVLRGPQQQQPNPQQQGQPAGARTETIGGVQVQVRPAGGGVPPITVNPPQGAYPANPAQQPGIVPNNGKNALSPAGFPQVPPDTQIVRDQERLAILREEHHNADPNAIAGNQGREREIALLEARLGAAPSVVGSPPVAAPVSPPPQATPQAPPGSGSAPLIYNPGQPQPNKQQQVIQAQAQLQEQHRQMAIKAQEIAGQVLQSRDVRQAFELQQSQLFQFLDPQVKQAIYMMVHSQR